MKELKKEELDEKIQSIVYEYYNNLPNVNYPDYGVGDGDGDGDDGGGVDDGVGYFDKDGADGGENDVDGHGDGVGESEKRAGGTDSRNTDNNPATIQKSLTSTVTKTIKIRSCSVTVPD